MDHPDPSYRFSKLLYANHADKPKHGLYFEEIFYSVRALLHESYRRYGFGLLFSVSFFELRLGFAHMDHSLMAPMRLSTC